MGWPREIKDIATHGYEIPNELFESTLGVARVDIEDDNYGHYSTLAMQYGEAAALHDDERVWQALTEGMNHLCFDGQNFFDTEHPVYHDHTGQSEQLERTRRSLRDAGVDTRNFAGDSAQLRGELKKREMLQNRLTGARAALGRTNAQ